MANVTRVHKYTYVYTFSEFLCSLGIEASDLIAIEIHTRESRTFGGRPCDGIVSIIIEEREQ